MQLTFLGTGTSQGVHMIGCRCPVCTSADPRDKRMRTSAAIRFSTGQVAVIDTSPEFRVCALAWELDRVDAVLYTHGHADHIMGLDDLRPFNQRQNAIAPCYGDAATIAVLRRTFGYAEIPAGGSAADRHPDRPGVQFNTVAGPFDLFGRSVVPVPLPHASANSVGYRIGRLAYCTDCSSVPDDAVRQLAGLDTLVLGMLRERPHPAHMHLKAALAAAGRIGARQTFFVHMSHDISHAACSAALPPRFHLAHDGLTVTVPE